MVKNKHGSCFHGTHIAYKKKVLVSSNIHCSYFPDSLEIVFPFLLVIHPRVMYHLCILSVSFLSSCLSVTLSLFFLFFSYKFIYFNWRLINLQYCVGFAIHQHESATSVHVFSILNPPSQYPPHTIPLGHPSAPAPSIMYHSLNLVWRFVSHMILYMFQCHSPKSSHPFPLPQSLCFLICCLG